MDSNQNISIPGFQEFMLPFLKILSDGKTRHMKEINHLIIKETGLTKEQCAVMLPSKAATVVRNRIGWVRTYLYKAGLIKQVSRGNYHITSEGLNAIEANPTGIKIAYLKTLPAFQTWGDSLTRDISNVGVSDHVGIKLSKDGQGWSLINFCFDFRDPSGHQIRIYKNNIKILAR